MRTITVVNLSTKVDREDFVSGVQAVHDQIDQDFAADWGIHVDLGFADKDPGKGERILMFDHTDQANALGYHSVDETFQPYGRVFVADAEQDGLPWTCDLSHEVIEQAADPYCQLQALGLYGGRLCLYGLEPADPVQRDQYLKSGRQVSNYVLPSWYVAGFNGAPVDKLGLLRQPFQLRPGGYAPVSIRLGQWAQIFAAGDPRGHAATLRRRRFARRQAVAHRTLGQAGAVSMPAGFALPPELLLVAVQLLRRYGPAALRLLAAVLENGGDLGQLLGPAPTAAGAGNGLESLLAGLTAGPDSP